MKTRIIGTFLMSAALMLGASKTPKPTAGSDTAIANELRQDILVYGRYSVFDNVSYGVTNGQVNLAGVVSDPSKKTAIDKLARSIRGVTGVNDDIQSLSDSPADNELRADVARAIYSNPVFDHYVSEEQQPVRIIVDRGQVTLEGVVQSNLEKEIAGVNASVAGLQHGPVVNDLQIVPASTKG